MKDGNLQRESILPSERVFARKTTIKNEKTAFLKCGPNLDTETVRSNYGRIYGGKL